MFSRTTLGNGITVIEAPMSGSRSITLLAMVPIGSRHEDDRESGAAHFLEHMLFKGTQKHPKAIQISRILDEVGAEFNAFTSKEYTGFYVKVDERFMERAALLLDEMLFESLLAKEEFERERGVIVEEIRMYEDTPMRHVYDLADEALYPKTRLGRNIAGSEASIRAMKLKDLRQFWNSHYRADTLVIAAAGVVEGVLPVLQKTFGARKRSGIYALTTTGVGRPGRRTPVVQTKETDQAHIVLSFPSLPYNRAGESATNILRTIFGGTMSSRLFTEIREKRGLAYAVSTNVDRYRDTGNFQIYAGLDRTRLPEALRVISAELRKIVQKGITERELKEAKSNMRGKMTLKMEDSTELASWYARGVLFYDEPWVPERYLDRVDTVEARAVHIIAEEILRPDRMAVACIGPYHEREFGQMLRGVFSL